MQAIVESRDFPEYIIKETTEMGIERFELEELTIARLHEAVQRGLVTFQQVTQMYLDRIEQYDKKGANINAIVTINPNALDDAKGCDRLYQKTGTWSGPLHGVPVLVKDQAQTAGLRTTFGSAQFAEYVPQSDATIVKKLRQAGAIILAKTAMPDFAAAWFSFSSMTGETKNPYALDRDPGGSSSGTAAAVTANFGLVGIGEDTGGSIRVPASFTGLYGLRVTTGTISRNGLSPLVHFQDTPGPMARTARDLALLLAVLVGYDPSDPFTTAALYQNPNELANLQAPSSLRGRRIGVLREVFGSADNAECDPVNQKIEQVLEVLRSEGAEIIDPVSIPHLQDHIGATAMYAIQSKFDLNRFFNTHADVPVTTFNDLYAMGQFHPMLDLFHDIARGPLDVEDEPRYYQMRFSQIQFKQVVMDTLARDHLDALAFPDVQILPPKHEELYAGKWTTMTFPTNTLIASQTSLPAISVPTGLTPAGLPVGIEFLGKEFDEKTLLELALAFEKAVHPRVKPSILKKSSS